MLIDTAHFTPLTALSGGLLIGLAASVLVVSIGKVAGISSVLGGLMTHPTTSAWRWAFVGGLVAVAWGWQAYRGVALTIETPSIWLVVAGLCVGVGTRYGAGCTSGHGVCGIARGSLRSVVATAVFMLVAMVTVWLRHRF